jgi:hypothetical protein
MHSTRLELTNTLESKQPYRTSQRTIAYRGIVVSKGRTQDGKESEHTFQKRMRKCLGLLASPLGY